MSGRFNLSRIFSFISACFLKCSSKLLCDCSVISSIFDTFNAIGEIWAANLAQSSSNEGKLWIFFYKYESFMAISSSIAALVVFILLLSCPIAVSSYAIFSVAFLSTSLTNNLRQLASCQPVFFTFSSSTISPPQSCFNLSSTDEPAEPIRLESSSIRASWVSSLRVNSSMKEQSLLLLMVTSKKLPMGNSIYRTFISIQKHLRQLQDILKISMHPCLIRKIVFACYLGMQLSKDGSYLSYNLQIQMNASVTRPIGTSVTNENPYLPTDSHASRQPDNRLPSSKMKSEQNSLYLSRFNGEIPEDRLRKSKAQSTKLIDSKLRRLSLKQQLVTVHEEKPLLNSTAAGQIMPGFEDDEFQNKNIKKFTISTLLKERELIKESNYFDQTHDPTENINPVADKHRADFRIGNLESFETFQIKTYLYDRNLTRKIAS